MKWRKKKKLKYRVNSVFMGVMVDGLTAKLFIDAIKPVTATDALAALIEHVIAKEILVNKYDDEDDEDV